ncbi:glutathione S-transferase family protein [Sinimarinibacterium sp. CAU 1509]|uniref:glutathione S-transferase family protein n=1 Tax=Sinimarinibacterium sp. CAU 1509 TaxID=2562283 RepID=UPI0010ABAB38|nr:glutathione S-transferase family protein [Sinimarinibacterium sp. CAU 1509]TJY62971.1 glutathione S-transferase family protein [Sinimarinibacterium sp. CAU 1509]
MRLITIPMSHYCEKARWALDHADVDYVEDAHLQVFHYRARRAIKAGDFVPVLVDGANVVADSTAILKFLDARLSERRKLYPAALRAEIESLEDDFDENLGVETRRWVYYHWITQPAREVLDIATQGTPRWQQRVAPLLFPMLRIFLRRHLQVSSDAVAQGLQVVTESFDRVAERLSDGRPFLCGDQFTAADLSFACMAAPVLLPRQYGIRLPTLEQTPLAARADVERFCAHPAGQFGLRLFREQRLRRVTGSTHADTAGSASAG